MISSIAQSEVGWLYSESVLSLETKDMLFSSDLGEAAARQLQVENICNTISTRKVRP